MSDNIFFLLAGIGTRLYGPENSLPSLSGWKYGKKEEEGKRKMSRA